MVAPFAGAWIEIKGRVKAKKKGSVAPFAGAWIEITKEKAMKVLDMSLPLRERGLKYADSYS